MTKIDAMVEMQEFVKGQLKEVLETVDNIGKESEFSFLFDGGQVVTMDHVVSHLEGIIKTIKSAN